MAEDGQEKKSCDKSISRKDFLKKVIKAGGLAAVPLILDQFPVQAQQSASYGRYTYSGGAFRLGA